MSKHENISVQVINRLPRYYRFLGELLDKNITRISSRELSDRMHLTASQIRQDLNCFGGFGQQGYGYSVQALHDEIGHILGIDNQYSAIMIGAGNLGKAVATQQLWYINSDKSEMSLVCDNVTSFDVRISKDSIELDTATIKSIDRNPQIVISLGLQRMNEKRIVSRTFSTRNQLNDNITLGKSVTSVEGDKEDVVNTLKVGNTLSAAQIIDYFTDN